MQDIIHLLPDSVANQIAAGEVIQRPASAVKELLENSIDAGAKKITLVVKEAGKTLIQIIDDGIGMSETDARMSFERHATSKLKSADDLFNISTKGFRGEALASIAAVAQVELKTKREQDTLGTKIEIWGSQIKGQDLIATETGTTFSIKNLFFNIPARRNFLKSNQVETQHILEEFYRVALAHPDIAFVLINNDSEMFRLEKGNLKQRVMGLFGNSYQEKLVPVNEETSIANIAGFIVKPEFAKKTRGEQYFFVNNRFIKSNYLHHAVQSGFESLIARENVAGYFLFITLNPATIDVNIHPTKTEIKFSDEKAIYSILRSSIKMALGKHNITPSLDFDVETSLNIPLPDYSKIPEPPKIRVNPQYNPFKVETEKAYAPQKSMFDLRQFNNISNWETLYESESKEEKEKEDKISNPERRYFQLFTKYIITKTKNQLLMIDQQLAHERILFERFLNQLALNSGTSQQMMFPVTIDFPAKISEIIHEILPDLSALGFGVENFGQNTWAFSGLPPGLSESKVQELLEEMVREFQDSRQQVKFSKQNSLAQSMAKNMSIKGGKSLSDDEMGNLVNDLFACETPLYTPTGKPVIVNFDAETIDKLFKK
jgi:DNA mismatch repair protein MutL